MAYSNEDMAGSYSVSFPKGFDYGPEGEGEGESGGALQEQKPRILLMGLRRSGKSSIQKVVFHKVSPNETLFLESTNKIVKEDVTNCSFFVYHVDGLSDDHKIEAQRDIHQRATEDLVDAGLENIHLREIDEMEYHGLSSGRISPISFHSDDRIKEDNGSSQMSSVIKLNNGTVMYLREVTKFLALVCILREDSFDKRGLIDFNFWNFRQGIEDVFALRNKKVLENGDVAINDNKFD
ncbi:RRAGD-like protein [Mya arenaria]|uniref:RRAGD-like protein n=1 Tax=Mya arenaria TaxID=6604 RepID=A0ABY7F3F8_MYAAR|nr:RRAGD-like protein [Mya arenaria]